MKEFDLIGDVGVHITAIAVSSMLATAKGEDVVFNIATKGGDLEQGKIIRRLIKNYSGKSIGRLIGDTASAGTIIAMGCDTVECDPTIHFLIHNASAQQGGNAKELTKTVSELKRHDSAMVSMYIEKTNLPEATIRTLMDKEDWLSPMEAKRYGFIDSIITAQYKAVAYKSNVNLSNELLIKLKQKMLKNPFITAKTEGAVSPVLAEMLEDGEYTLEDGRKIRVTGGVAEIIEAEPAKEEVAAAIPEEEKPTEAAIDADAIVEAVSAMVVGEIANIEAKLDAKIEALKTITSTHSPVKGTITANAGQKAVTPQAHVQEITNKIHENISKNRQK